jgi:glycosyltransferase involved in cell wall biosynthesis
LDVAEPSVAELEEVVWLRQFERERGRPLRVLHVGNIANNAYLNASFLRRVGIDCHVLCYDYYDPMATPEWEASPEEAAEYRRPYWFVQGPSKVALAYLHAVLDGRRAARTVLWWRLELLKLLLVDPRTRALGVGVKRTGRLGLSYARRARRRLAHARSWSWSLARWGARRTGRAVGLDMPEPPLGPTLSAEARRLYEQGVQASSLPVDGDLRYEVRRLELMRDFGEAFPGRLDVLAPPDFVWYANVKAWAALFDRYDVVQCYATDPIVALLTALRPFVAFEHGTLRDFTLGDDPIHRLNALAYRCADHVFITNGDCLEYAERLGIERFTPMIHPVDVDQHERDYAAEVVAIRARIGADVVLFCPLRHDWTIKGTDVHIRALPAIVAATPGTVKLWLCEWGADLPASRALIEELGIADNVAWLPPLDRSELVAHMKAADVLLDQMALPHFGATAPQGLAAGTPVVMSYDPASTEWIVDEPAPILSAFDAAGVAAAVATALDPAWRDEFASRAYEWIHREHHPRRVVLEHCRVYRRLTEEHE